MTLLEVTDVESGYGDVQVINGASLEVAEGEIVTLIGPNGAGKSTLLKTIAGLLTPWSGEVRYQGEEITGRPPEDILEDGLCYVPQTTNVFPDLTVYENLKMGGWILEDGFDDRTADVFDHFPVLEERQDARVRELSGGQQQMVALGQALILNPDLLLLDEPSAGLAPQLIKEIFNHVTAINSAGTTILMVEQNARDALEISDRGVVLDMGEDRFVGTGNDLLDSEEVARLYLGG